MEQAAKAVLSPEPAVEYYGPMVFRAAYGLVKNQHDAEDIAQEVFISLLKSAPAFESPEHQKAWLLRCTINRCKSQFRSAWHRHTTAMDETLSVPFTTEENLVLQAVNALPKKYRSVMLLYYIEGYSTAETADILGLKQNTVLSQMARARAMLKKTLKGEFEL